MGVNATGPVSPEIMQKIVANGLLNFTAKNNDGGTQTQVNIPQSSDSSQASSAALTQTLKDLIPGLFGVGAGLVARKAGLNPEDAVGLGATVMNAGQSIQSGYRANKRNYYNNIASRLIDEYVAKSGGQVDSNLIYKTLHDDHPDIFKNINPGELLQRKMDERNKIIDLSTNEYTSDFSARNAYEQSKGLAFRSGGQLISPRPDIGGNINYHYANYQTMVNRLNEKYPNKYVYDTKDGSIRFKEEKDYDAFKNYISGLVEKDPDGKPYQYDMTEVLKTIKPPADDMLAKRKAEIDRINAQTEYWKSRKNLLEGAGKKSTRGGSGKEDTVFDYQRLINQAWISDSIEATDQLAVATYKHDRKEISDEEFSKIISDLKGHFKDAQDKPNEFLQFLMGKTAGSGEAAKDKGAVY